MMNISISIFFRYLIFLRSKWATAEGLAWVVLKINKRHLWISRHIRRRKLTSVRMHSDVLKLRMYIRVSHLWGRSLSFAKESLCLASTVQYSTVQYVAAKSFWRNVCGQYQMSLFLSSTKKNKNLGKRSDLKT